MPFSEQHNERYMTPSKIQILTSKYCPVSNFDFKRYASLILKRLIDDNAKDASEIVKNVHTCVC